MTLGSIDFASFSVFGFSIFSTAEKRKNGNNFRSLFRRVRGILQSDGLCVKNIFWLPFFRFSVFPQRDNFEKADMMQKKRCCKFFQK